ncbi:hypothetical protein [Deinococcus sp.]|uniref:hypothetical protein n=1 Tax=Deinococcus sp. TaxID=47478 RepID=UPI0025FEAD67|nr:hypothetical protein [Deinococcus sp.]
MNTKSILLTALLLAPFAGAASVQPSATPPALVSVKAAALPQAQAPVVSSTLLAKTSTAGLPQALNDQELDEVTGEVLPLVIIAVRVGGGAALGAVIGAVKSYQETGKVNAGSVALGAAGGAATGGFGAFLKIKGF